MPLMLPSSYEVVEKGDFLGPRFVGVGILQISEICFQIALTMHVASFGSFPSSELTG